MSCAGGAVGEEATASRTRGQSDGQDRQLEWPAPEPRYASPTPGQDTETSLPCRQDAAEVDAGANLARWREKLRQRGRQGVAADPAQQQNSRRSRDDEHETWRRIERLVQRLTPQRRPAASAETAPEPVPEPTTPSGSLLSRLRLRRRRAEPASQPANHAFEFRVASAPEGGLGQSWWPGAPQGEAAFAADGEEQLWVQSPLYEPLLEWPAPAHTPAVEVRLDAEGEYSVPVLPPGGVPIDVTSAVRSIRSQSPEYQYPHLVTGRGEAGQCRAAGSLADEADGSSSSPGHDYAVPVPSAAARRMDPDWWERPESPPTPRDGALGRLGMVALPERQPEITPESPAEGYSAIYTPHDPEFWRRPPSPPTLTETPSRVWQRPVSPSADLWQRPKSPQTMPRSYMRCPPGQPRPPLQRCLPVPEEEVAPPSRADPPASLPTSRRRVGRRRRAAAAVDAAESDSEEDRPATVRVRSRRRPRLRRSSSMDSGHYSAGGRGRPEPAAAAPPALGVDSGHGSGSIGSQKDAPQNGPAGRDAAEEGRTSQRTRRSETLMPDSGNKEPSPNEVGRRTGVTPDTAAESQQAPDSNMNSRICARPSPKAREDEKAVIADPIANIETNAEFSKNSNLFSMLMTPVQAEIDSIMEQATSSALSASSVPEEACSQEPSSADNTLVRSTAAASKKIELHTTCAEIPPPASAGHFAHSAGSGSGESDHESQQRCVPQHHSAIASGRTAEAQVLPCQDRLRSGLQEAPLPPQATSRRHRLSLPALLLPLPGGVSDRYSAKPPSPRLHPAPGAPGVSSPPPAGGAAWKPEVRRFSCDAAALAAAGRPRSAEFDGQRQRRRPERRRSLLATCRPGAAGGRRLSAHFIRDTGVIIPAVEDGAVTETRAQLRTRGALLSLEIRSEVVSCDGGPAVAAVVDSNTRPASAEVSTVELGTGVSARNQTLGDTRHVESDFLHIADDGTPEEVESRQPVEGDTQTAGRDVPYLPNNHECVPDKTGSVTVQLSQQTDTMIRKDLLTMECHGTQLSDSDSGGSDQGSKPGGDGAPEHYSGDEDGEFQTMDSTDELRSFRSQAEPETSETDTQGPTVTGCAGPEPGSNLSEECVEASSSVENPDVADPPLFCPSGSDEIQESAAELCWVGVVSVGGDMEGERTRVDSEDSTAVFRRDQAGAGQEQPRSDVEDGADGGQYREAAAAYPSQVGDDMSYADGSGGGVVRSLHLHQCSVEFEPPQSQYAAEKKTAEEDSVPDDNVVEVGTDDEVIEPDNCKTAVIRATRLLNGNETPDSSSESTCGIGASGSASDEHERGHCSASETDSCSVAAPVLSACEEAKPRSSEADVSETTASEAKDGHRTQEQSNYRDCGSRDEVSCALPEEDGAQTASVPPTPEITVSTEPFQFPATLQSSMSPTQRVVSSLRADSRECSRPGEPPAVSSCCDLSDIAEAGEAAASLECRPAVSGGSVGELCDPPAGPPSRACSEGTGVGLGDRRWYRRHASVPAVVTSGPQRLLLMHTASRSAPGTSVLPDSGAGASTSGLAAAEARRAVAFLHSGVARTARRSSDERRALCKMHSLPVRLEVAAHLAYSAPSLEDAVAEESRRATPARKAQPLLRSLSDSQLYGACYGSGLNPSLGELGSSSRYPSSSSSRVSSSVSGQVGGAPRAAAGAAAAARTQQPADSRSMKLEQAWTNPESGDEELSPVGAAWLMYGRHSQRLRRCTEPAGEDSAPGGGGSNSGRRRSSRERLQDSAVALLRRVSSLRQSRRKSHSKPRVADGSCHHADGTCCHLGRDGAGGGLGLFAMDANSNVTELPPADGHVWKRSGSWRGPKAPTGGRSSDSLNMGQESAAYRKKVQGMLRRRRPSPTLPQARAASLLAPPCWSGSRRGSSESITSPGSDLSSSEGFFSRTPSGRKTRANSSPGLACLFRDRSGSGDSSIGLGSEGSQGSVGSEPERRQRRAAAVPWHGFSSCSASVTSPLYSPISGGVQLTQLTCGQIAALRKQALARVTAAMERHCPARSPGWGWELPRLMRLRRAPDFRDRHVFGVPLAVTLRRTGHPLPPPILQAILHLRQTALLEVGLFRKSGVRSRIQKLRDACEEASEESPVDFSEYTPFDVADLLKLYLRELPGLLLTSRISQILIAVYRHVPFGLRRELTRSALLLLPDESRLALQTILALLSDVTAARHANHMSAHNLAVCLAPSLLSGGGAPSRAGSASPRRGRQMAPPDRQLDENRAAHECLTALIRQWETLLHVPEELLSLCRPQPLEALQPAPLACLGTEAGSGWREYVDSCCVALLREVKERTRGWDAVPSEEEGVELASRKVGDGHRLRLWRASVEVEAPPQEVLQLLLRQRHLVDPRLQRCSVLARLADDAEVLQYWQMAPPPLPSVQFCVLSAWRADLPRGACAVIQTSVHHPDAEPSERCGTVLVSRHLVEPGGAGRSRVTHFSRIDQRGFSPDWYSSVYGQQCAQELATLRRVLCHPADGPESRV